MGQTWPGEKEVTYEDASAPGPSHLLPLTGLTELLQIHLSGSPKVSRSWKGTCKKMSTPGQNNTGAPKALTALMSGGGVNCWEI